MTSWARTVPAWIYPMIRSMSGQCRRIFSRLTPPRAAVLNGLCSPHGDRAQRTGRDGSHLGDPAVPRCRRKPPRVRPWHPEGTGRGREPSRAVRRTPGGWSHAGDDQCDFGPRRQGRSSARAQPLRPRRRSHPYAAAWSSLRKSTGRARSPLPGARSGDQVAGPSAWTRRPRDRTRSASIPR